MNSKRLFLLGAVTLTAGLSLMLAGCGFELQRARPLPFKHIQLAGFDERSPMAAALKHQIDATGSTTVVESMARADVILLCLLDKRQKVAATSSAFAQVTDITLTSRLRFMVRTPDGRVLILPTEVTLARDMNYSETHALAKEQEADNIYRFMENDIAAQVVRRLAALKMPAK